MKFAHAVLGPSVVAALLAVVAIAPLPAAAGAVVHNSTLVCADVTLFPYGIGLEQNSAAVTAQLQLTGPANANLSLTVKATGGLPPSTPAACAIVCVVDGIPSIFEIEKFKPCGTTTAGGKLTFTGTVPFVGSEPFDGGCLLPVPALWVKPAPEPNGLAPVPSDPLVVCVPGFGTFGSACLGECDPI